MNPNVLNRVAIAAAVASASVFAIATASGSRRCQTVVPPHARAIESALNEERAAVEMASDQAEADRAATEAQRAAEMAEAAAEEAEYGEVTDREEELNKIRQAAKDYVKNRIPDAKADGVFLLPLYPESLFIAGVDTQLSDGKRKTIDLLVRRYVRKGTSSYWRAESLDGGQNTVIKTRK